MVVVVRAYGHKKNRGRAGINGKEIEEYKTN